jgi:cell division protein FtsL
MSNFVASVKTIHEYTPETYYSCMHKRFITFTKIATVTLSTVIVKVLFIAHEDLVLQCNTLSLTH